jgi:hypothetical protein
LSSKYGGYAGLSVPIVSVPDLSVSIVSGVQSASDVVAADVESEEVSSELPQAAIRTEAPTRQESRRYSRMREWDTFDL